MDDPAKASDRAIGQGNGNSVGGDENGWETSSLSDPPSSLSSGLSTPLNLPDTYEDYSAPEARPGSNGDNGSDTEVQAVIFAHVDSDIAAGFEEDSDSDLSETVSMTPPESIVGEAAEQSEAQSKPEMAPRASRLGDPSMDSLSAWSSLKQAPDTEPELERKSTEPIQKSVSEPVLDSGSMEELRMVSNSTIQRAPQRSGELASEPVRETVPEISAELPRRLTTSASPLAATPEPMLLSPSHKTLDIPRKPQTPTTPRIRIKFIKRASRSEEGKSEEPTNLPLSISSTPARESVPVRIRVKQAFQKQDCNVSTETAQESGGNPTEEIPSRSSRSAGELARDLDGDPMSGAPMEAPQAATEDSGELCSAVQDVEAPATAIEEVTPETQAATTVKDCASLPEQTPDDSRASIDMSGELSPLALPERLHDPVAELSAISSEIRQPSLLREPPQPIATSLPISGFAGRSSVPSLVSSKATTPADIDTPSEPLPASLPLECTPPTPESAVLHNETWANPPSTLSKSYTPGRRVVHNVRPKSSIPTNLSLRNYARQCIAAAESSRLNPYALHEEEHSILRQHISHAQVTTYLNIRNGILRLWLRKPHTAITREDAIGCAKDSRWFDVASVCFDWLLRRGYINYGCVSGKAPQTTGHSSTLLGESTDNIGHSSSLGFSPGKRRKRVVVIGAGMAGLGCARQLETIFTQYADTFSERNEEPPEVVVLEGRNRIGGRVYSRAFHIQPKHPLPGFENSRCTAEAGGMIITGFDRGNPLNVLVRGQLGLNYHNLLSEATLYDTNGRPVDSARDSLVENLFNECLDRVSEYKFKLPILKHIEGKHDLIDEGRDTSSEGHRTLAVIEDAAAAAAAAATIADVPPTAEPTVPSTEISGMAGPTGTPIHSKAASSSSSRLPELSSTENIDTATTKAAQKLRLMGWDLKAGVEGNEDLDLDAAAGTEGATLGFVTEEALKQYQQMVDLTPQDFRLLNWHIANMEYSNATNHCNLSLRGWDIDAGNEWEGKHSMVAGGFQSVPRGLMLYPSPLKVHRNMAVSKIAYPTYASASTFSDGSNPPALIECENGRTFEADYVVNTIPLGVLKYGSVEFDPPLPDWKADSIHRLGYGTLNKIIMTYRKPFWDTRRDIFGVLRAPTNQHSLNQADYSHRRGRMFQWFNVTHTTGVPCLLALMAGDAAYDTEKATNDDLITEATAVLRSVFGVHAVPNPIEAFVTRWRSDKFSRGSYSSAGPEMKIDDYDIMARPVGKHLFFAGEHTTGTHPATVHGAYLSGLRAASEIVEEILGPIQAPSPLIIPRETQVALKRKLVAGDEESMAGGGNESSGSVSGSASGSGYTNSKTRNRQRTDMRETQIQESIREMIGVRPEPPARVVDTSYLLFAKATYDRARRICDERRRPGKGRAPPNEVRVLISKMWRSASAEERQPFAEQAAAQKQAYLKALQEYSGKVADWDRRAAEARAAFEKEHSAAGTPALGTSTTGTPVMGTPLVGMATSGTASGMVTSTESEASMLTVATGLGISGTVSLPPSGARLASKFDPGAKPEQLYPLLERLGRMVPENRQGNVYMAG